MNKFDEAVKAAAETAVLKKYSVDLTFVKSAKCPLFGWVGTALNKCEAEMFARDNARRCGYSARVKSVKFNTVVDEVTP